SRATFLKFISNFDRYFDTVRIYGPVRTVTEVPQGSYAINAFDNVSVVPLPYWTRTLDYLRSPFSNTASVTARLLKDADKWDLLWLRDVHPATVVAYAVATSRDISTVLQIAGDPAALGQHHHAGMNRVLHQGGVKIVEAVQRR
ncbi:hypothetical protein PM076_17995, partial [Halorubrum ezzemoulense]